MSGNMAFFFDLVALDLVALCLVALCLVALCLVARPGASMCCTLHHSAPPITPPIHFQGAAAVGYDGGTLWRLPKSETPRGRTTCGASVQSPPSAVAKALGAILAPTLTPCTAWLVRPALGAVHDFTPCSCPARPCWRRPLEREPAEVAPENAKSGNLGGGVHRP